MQMQVYSLHWRSESEFCLVKSVMPEISTVKSKTKITLASPGLELQKMNSEERQRWMKPSIVFAAQKKTRKRQKGKWDECIFVLVSCDKQKRILLLKSSFHFI